MKKCNHCQSEIDVKATKCPHCQADLRSWPKRHPILTGLFGLIVLFVVLGIIGSSGSKSNSSQTVTKADQGASQAVQATQTPQQPTVVDATALVSEFDKNKLAAQDQYKGKLIETTAYIANISQDITGTYYLSLKPSSDKYYSGTSLQCFFNDKTQLTSLANGQSVKVQGTMDDMLLGTVVMKSCSVVK